MICLLRFWLGIAVIAGFVLVSNDKAFSSIPEVVPDEYVIVFEDSEQATAFASQFPSETQIETRVVLFRTPHMASSNGAAQFQESTCQSIKAAVPSVRICEPNYIFRATVVPNDPLFPHLAALQRIDAPKAWGITTGSKDIVVAVIDTGIDSNHPDLHSNLWINPGTAADPEGKGFHGANLIFDNYDTSDPNGHGTHVAGIIGAVGNNGLGISGVAWNIRLMAVNFLNHDGYGTLFNAVRAIDYAIDNGAHIINASWGSSFNSLALKEAVERAHQAGITIVAASGNSTNNNDTKGFYPASYRVENVVSVAALNNAGASLASFSNFGSRRVHLAAPGTQILSTWPGGGYAFMDGTSMAAPFVSGALALLQSALKDETAQILRRRVLSGQSLKSLKGMVSTSARLNVWSSFHANPFGPDNPSAHLDLYSVRRGAVSELSEPRSLRRRGYLLRLHGESLKDGDRVRVRVRAAGKRCTLGRAFIENGAAEIQGRIPAGLRGRLIFRTAHGARTRTRVRTRRACPNGNCTPVRTVAANNFHEICTDLRTKVLRRSGS